MSKAKKKKPTVPECPWDKGTGTVAQSSGLVEEDAFEIDPETGKRSNPNNVRRMRRMDYAERLLRRGAISQEGFLAAQKLMMAWEAMQTSPPAIKEIQVDCSSQPDANMAAQVDKASKYHRIAKMFPVGAFDLIWHCCAENRSIMKFYGVNTHNYKSWIKKLSDGLDAGAEEMGIVSEERFR